jgi:hypothetical protein
MSCDIVVTLRPVFEHLKQTVIRIMPGQGVFVVVRRQGFEPRTR